MRHKFYGFVVYPAFVESKWKDHLKKICQRVYCSPVHTEDKDGRKILEHYHVFVVFKNPIYIDRANFLLSEVRPVCLKPIVNKVPFISVYNCKLM